ncbi:hypothetical protein VC60_gp81 [Mycobacterium phage Sbash]|uniref:Uncharacterized protein n=1 Tax=Mycobacterium phage Sbash TaxID=1567475 RepID=A0A0A7RY08_9CAUD|nr:hypothetical protein VC60_gp81 [Mycobacterium phage Sbash]AJA43382.1 hypothetical protein PBI_SBASH_81 [Mycobacterium phage Sbash]
MAASRCGSPDGLHASRLHVQRRARSRPLPVRSVAAVRRCIRPARQDRSVSRLPAHPARVQVWVSECPKVRLTCANLAMSHAIATDDACTETPRATGRGVRRWR